MMQCHISESLSGLDFKSRYGLRDYFDSRGTLIIFGMYRDRDLKLYLKHPGEVIVVWTGSDAYKLNPRWASYMKSRQATHYSISQWISDRLASFDIESTYAPISATTGKANPVPR